MNCTEKVSSERSNVCSQNITAAWRQCDAETFKQLLIIVELATYLFIETTLRMFFLEITF